MRPDQEIRRKKSDRTNQKSKFSEMVMYNKEEVSDEANMEECRVYFD